MLKILILKYLTTYHKQNNNWLWARWSSDHGICLLCRANIWMDVNCPIVHPFHMSICSPSAFPTREIIIDHRHASNTQKQHGVKMSSSLSPSWRRWWWKKTRRWKKWTSCRRGNFMRRGREIFEGTFKKALAASSCCPFWSSSPPPNTLISYSQRPVWHDRPLTPQMAAL